MRLGADPELFLTDLNGNLKAVCGMLDGHDKWNPMPVQGLSNGYTFQEDNVAVEFGIPPASTVDEFVMHIKTVQQAFLNQYKDVKFTNISAAVFPESEMTHPSAHIFGCEPDFNAWTRKVNKKPKPPVPTLRSAGGHVHIETTLPVGKVIQACDLFLGVPSVLMDDGQLRKKLYGKAGAYRRKPYGCEYRTLSNFWVFEEKYTAWVWRSVERALKFVESKGDLSPYRDMIVRSINDNDTARAKHLVSLFSLELV